MLTYFAWRKETERYDPRVHARCDLDILELSIDHREGEVALATVIVAQIKVPPLEQRHVYISVGDELIFSGRLLGLPIKIKNNVISLELTAEPINALEQLQAIEADLKQAPYWDSAFVEHTEYQNPSEWLEGRTALFAWDRVSGVVYVTDLFQGRHVLDLTNVFFSDSLKVSLAETPLAQISVILTAEWTQKAEVELSLGTKISSAFPGGIINTLTPQALEATWPKEGMKIGRSGFWVVKSQLKRIQPPKTGILNLYPTLTPELKIWDDTTQTAKLERGRRVWLFGTLVLGWRYRQKRREIVQFTLKHKTQLDGTIRPLRRVLNLRLQQVEALSGHHEATSTFFLTRRGRQTVEHALEIARAHLAASARCLEVEITMPFNEGIGLTMDHTIQLKDERIPGGAISGKAIAYKLYQDGVKSYAWLRFVASIGTKTDPLPELKQTLYADSAYGDTTFPHFYATASGLFYENYSQQKTKEGILGLEALEAHDILREVFVSHDAEKQISFLQSQQYPIRQNLRGALEEVPTVISLDLKSLKGRSVLEHTINLEILREWTAPKQVDLAGEVHL
ncbi:MAG: hypothetical protein FJX71_00455 [Alphaproteobacteria bacterium]|nr:hypothetical protein [Alphaproteobacteria bacterium]